MIGYVTIGANDGAKNRGNSMMQCWAPSAANANSRTRAGSERVCINTMESGSMTKNLAILVGPISAG